MNAAFVQMVVFDRLGEAAGDAVANGQQVSVDPFDAGREAGETDRFADRNDLKPFQALFGDERTDERRIEIAGQCDIGPGCRQMMKSGMPSSIATLRTSSLNSSRRGSMSASFMTSGSPPTLWWLLMFAVPVPPPDSTTSG